MDGKAPELLRQVSLRPMVAWLAITSLVLSRIRCRLSQIKGDGGLAESSRRLLPDRDVEKLVWAAAAYRVAIR